MDIRLAGSLDPSTTESPAGQVSGEAVPVLNKQRSKDDMKSDIKTTGATTFKDVLYKIVKTKWKANASFMESET